MTMFVSAFLFASVFCGLALRANARFRSEDRLPMQWWFTGDVTWSARRPIALALIPALAVSVLVSLIALSLTVRPRPGQEDLVFPIFIGIGIMFIAVQILHLWLIDKTLRRNGG